MHPPEDSSATDLAALICGPVRYKFDLLVDGIRIEQRRLATGAYLLLLWRQDLDWDGMVDWLYLGDSFATVEAARQAATQQLADLQRAYTSLPNRYHDSYSVDPTAFAPFMRTAPDETSLKVLNEQTLRLVASGFDKQTFRTHVVGRFNGPIVGPALFDFLKSAKSDLWTCLTDIGESSAAGRPRRSPLPGASS